MRATTSRILALGAAAALLTAGCSGDDADDRSGLMSRPGADRVATSPGASASASAAVDPAAPASGVATPSGGAAARSAPAAAARPSASTGPAAVAPAPGAVDATAPGDYVYDVDGTVTVGTPQPVDGEATLTVDPAAAGQQHTVLEGDQGRTEQDVVLRADGRYLALLSITNPAFSKAFSPTPPVLLLPEPAVVGRTWAWTATSDDGATTARTSNRVAREETLTIGGTRVRCTVVETTLVLSGDVDYRGRTTTWVAQEQALPVKESSQGSGTVSGFAFSQDTTSTLRSVRPA